MRMAAPERSRRTPAQSIARKVQLRPSGSIVPALNCTRQRPQPLSRVHAPAKTISQTIPDGCDPRPKAAADPSPLADGEADKQTRSSAGELATRAFLAR